MLLNQDGTPWLCRSNEERMENYSRYRKLYKAKKSPDWYLGSRWKRERRKIQIIVNFPGLITRACADLLFGEPPTFSANDGANDDLQKIIRRNLFQAECFQSELANSYRGDAVFRGRLNAKKDDIVIETIPAHNYYIEPNAHDCRIANAEIIAWVNKASDGVTDVVFIQRHTSGLIQEFARLAVKIDEGNGVNYKVGDEVSLDFAYGIGAAPDRETETGLDDTLLEHVPNFEDDEQYWGVGDYYDLCDLFEAANNRISCIDSYQDTHSRPKLVGTNDLTDIEGNFDFNTDFIAVNNPEQNNTPRYLVWDGKMESAFHELEYLEKKIFQVSEMSQAIFGIDIATSVDSSMAMRQFFTRTKAKINRKRMIYDQRLKNFLQRTMEFGKFMGLGIKAPTEIGIAWQDGIPRDYVEQVQAEAARKQAGLTSDYEAVMRIDMCSEDEAKAKVAAMHAEKAQYPGMPVRAPQQQM